MPVVFTVHRITGGHYIKECFLDVDFPIEGQVTGRALFSE
jgi:hypothetical protein